MKRPDKNINKNVDENSAEYLAGPDMFLTHSPLIHIPSPASYRKSAMIWRFLRYKQVLHQSARYPKPPYLLSEAVCAKREIVIGD
jgi:hypothetical protein